MSKEISYSRRLAAALGPCLAVAAIAALGAEHKFDGVYLRKRVLKARIHIAQPKMVYLSLFTEKHCYLPTAHYKNVLS